MSIFHFSLLTGLRTTCPSGKKNVERGDWRSPQRFSGWGVAGSNGTLRARENPNPN